LSTIPIGLQVAFIPPESWKPHVKTLSVKALDRHTGQSLASHVQKELDDFDNGDRTAAPLFSTHDGAANMMKCSALLPVEDVTHCVAHSIHLLLTVDLLFKVGLPEIVDTIKKCKERATTLHFKGCILVKESLGEQGRNAMNDLMKMINEATAMKDLDEAADDAMLFWRNHISIYPTLRHVARRHLTSSASSVPVESMFSTTGLILNSKRSSLAPHKLNYCTFIHDNSR